MKGERVIYIPQLVTLWENVLTGSPVLETPVPLKPVKGMGKGFLPVYDNYKEARQDYPKSRIKMFTVKEVGKINEG